MFGKGFFSSSPMSDFLPQAGPERKFAFVLLELEVRRSCRWWILYHLALCFSRMISWGPGGLGSYSELQKAGVQWQAWALELPCLNQTLLLGFLSPPVLSSLSPRARRVGPGVHSPATIFLLCEILMNTIFFEATELTSVDFFPLKLWEF